MIEHVSIPVSNVVAAKDFYDLALAPLDYQEEHDWGTAIGYLENGHTSFVINEVETVIPTHIAFRAENKKAVDNFHKAALKAGASDNGVPGYREDYSPGYYAAFILDPDGNNVEAVWFDPEREK